MPRTRTALPLLICALLAACAPPPDAGFSGLPEGPEDVVEHVDLSAHFAGMEGTFVVVDGRSDARACASGPDFALAWDSAAAPPAPYWPDSWKRGQTLRSSLQNSVYWYYQELARRIGEPRMREHLARFGYGNQDMGGGIDRFWLHGGLRISPLEQIGFLRRFHAGELGVSTRSTELVKEMLLLEETPAYRLSGKTGTADVTPTRELGWLVGWVEAGGETYFYALNMEGERRLAPAQALATRAGPAG